MASIHLSTSSNGGNLIINGNNDHQNVHVGDATMPKYVGARAIVERVEDGVRITLTDYKGTTQETINDGADGTNGNDGAAAGFGTVSATADSGVGTPSVTVTTSGADTAKNFAFAFSNIKGEKGDTGDALPYGECSTAKGTAAKTVSIPGVTSLDEGMIIAVKFTNTNTSADPTLQVNSLTAKAIKRYGTTAPSTSAASSWNAGSVVLLLYDGSYWQMVDFNNTTYSAMTQSEMQTGTATTGRNITAARLKEAVEYHALVTSVNGSTGAVTVKVLVIDIASFSSLPQTISDSSITADHVCLKAELGTPSAQTGDWTVTTSAGSLTISGSISGSTTAKLYLAIAE